MKKLIVTIGHSVVKTTNGSWIPSEIYQTVTIAGHEKNRISRTFLHQPGLDPETPNVVLGGGKVVVRALFEVCRNDMSVDVAIIGGRPHHMDSLFGKEVSHISEASIMADFLAIICQEAKVKKLPNITVIEGTRNTEDDIAELMKLARFYDQTTVITMSFRLFRVQLLVQDFVQKNEEFAHVPSRIVFRDAEQFLPDMFDQFVQMNQSAAYARTMAQERQGVMAKLRGSKEDYIRTA